jgi:hypothetical protein
MYLLPQGDRAKACGSAELNTDIFDHDRNKSRVADADGDDAGGQGKDHAAPVIVAHRSTDSLDIFSGDGGHRSRDRLAERILDGELEYACEILRDRPWVEKQGQEEEDHLDQAMAREKRDEHCVPPSVL